MAKLRHCLAGLILDGFDFGFDLDDFDFDNFDLEDFALDEVRDFEFRIVISKT